MISTRLDGELNDTRDQAVREHLAGCARCQAFAADLECFASQLDSIGAPDPRWGFSDRVMARLDQPGTSRLGPSAWLDFLRPAPLGAGVAAFCLGALLTVWIAGENAGIAGATREPDAEMSDRDYVDEYFDEILDDGVEETLLALLPEA